MQSSPRRGTWSFKGRSTESTSKSDTSQTSPGQRRAEVMARPISKNPKRGIYYAQCRYQGRPGEPKKKVQAQAQDRKGSVQLGIRAPEAHEGRTQHDILRVLRGLCGGLGDAASANHARGQDRYERHQNPTFSRARVRERDRNLRYPQLRKRAHGYADRVPNVGVRAVSLERQETAIA